MDFQNKAITRNEPFMHEIKFVKILLCEHKDKVFVFSLGLERCPGLQPWN